MPNELETIHLGLLVFLFHLSLSVCPVSCNLGILASTLYTFQKYACDGDHLKMNCPLGTMISIQFAQYGRQVPSYQKCPAETMKLNSQRNSGLYFFKENTNCLATSSLQILLKECQDKQQCHLLASAETFQQDPCPGTMKYLDVAYKCRPDDFKSHTVCEDTESVIACNKSHRIVIYSAMYGRSTDGDSSTCLHSNSPNNIECKADGAVRKVMKTCHGRKKCRLHATESHYGNPCEYGIEKYLHVIYTCVPKRVLKNIRHNSGGGGSKRGHKKKRKKGTDDGTNKNTLTTLKPVKNIPPNVTTPPVYVYSKDDTQTIPIADSPSVIYQPPATSDNKMNNDKPPDLGNTVLNNNMEVLSTTVSSLVTIVCNNESDTQLGRSSSRSSIGFLADWFRSFYFLEKNQEKVILYLVLGCCFGIIVVLSIVTVKLIIENKRRSRVKLNVTSNDQSHTHENHNSNHRNHMEVPTLERSESIDRIEVVRFSPHGTLRSDFGNRSLSNYYG